MFFYRLPDSFDDDENKYQKTAVRSTRLKILLGVAIICAFVVIMRLSSSYVKPNVATNNVAISADSVSPITENESTDLVVAKSKETPPAETKAMSQEIDTGSPKAEAKVPEPVNEDMKFEQVPVTSDLLEQYIKRPAVYQPPESSLRQTTTYPLPPPQVDEMCKPEYPEPIPELTKPLQSFSDYLLTQSESLLTTGKFSFAVPSALTSDYHALNEQRAAHIRGLTCFTWANYRERAWGQDELGPMNGNAKNNWGGVSMTAIDSLDTLWLMGLKKEVQNARSLVERLNFDLNRGSSLFELNIRITGGLLAMYDFTQDSLYLKKAEDLVTRMLPAFNTPSGYPHNSINLHTGTAASPSWTGGNAILAEVGTNSVEILYLAAKTRNRKFKKVMDKLYDSLSKATTMDGILPMRMNVVTGQGSGGPYSMSGGADSYYEYLVKMWILEGKKDERIRTMYNNAVNGITKHILRRSPSGLLYTSDYEGGHNGKTMGSLACFTGGMLALGVLHNINPNTRDRDLENAKSLAYTCYRMYISTATGIAGESMIMDGPSPRVNPRAPYYILRPEALETMYYLNQITGDPIYREWGWRMWQGIEKSTKTNYGFGHLFNVDSPNSKENNMESFFLAETVKYAYLLFKDDKVVDLTKQVFNTEAHPVHTVACSVCCQ